MPSGITSQTAEHYIIGPGALYKGFQDPTNPGTLIGATSGGNTFRVEVTWFDPRPDGALGPIKGLRRKIREEARLEARLVELTKENFLLAFAGASSTAYPETTPTHDLITPAREVPDTAYADIALVGEVSGSAEPIIVVLLNALSVEIGELAFGTGEEEVVLPVTFVAHYDPASADTPPWRIYKPKVA